MQPGEPGHFTGEFLNHPDELRREIREAGFCLEALLAIEGAAVCLQDLEEQWQDPGRHQRILQVLRWLEDEPSMLGTTGHVSVIATKPM